MVKLLKNYLRGKLLTSMDSIFGKVSVYKNLFLQNLPWTFLDDYLQTINGISPEEVSDSVAKYFISDQKISLVVS